MAHQRRYPKMRLPDQIKLIYQNEFAGGHLITDAAASRARLEQEVASLTGEAPADLPEQLFLGIGNGLCRLNLWDLRGLGVDLATVNNFFLNTANSHQGAIASFERKLRVLAECCQSGDLPYALADLDDYLATYRQQGYPAVSHSPTYREQYRPAYRVVGAVYGEFWELFLRLDKLLAAKHLVTVAIDGNSGAGKSTLAQLLGRVYGCNLFHMDDFFLPPELRTAERLAEPGGNVDYRRFQQEVLQGIASGRDFQYRPYDCKRTELANPISVTPKRLNIVEGSYSHHPTLVGSYQLKVFLTVDPAEQLRRIKQRNGEAMQKRFRREWIPLENHYFQELDVPARSDLVFQR